MAQVPDSPQPKSLDQRLNERYGDPLQFDSVNKSWTAAAKSPGMIAGGLALAGSTALDLASTQRCIDNHTCKEGNPILGQSAAQRYSVSIAVAALVYVVCVHEKQRGHGVMAFTGVYAASAAHFLAWSMNRGK